MGEVKKKALVIGVYLNIYLKLWKINWALTFRFKSILGIILGSSWDLNKTFGVYFLFCIGEVAFGAHPSSSGLQI